MPNSIRNLPASPILDLSSTWLQRREQLLRSPSPIIKLALVGLAITMAGLLGLAVPAKGAEVLAAPIILFAALLFLIRPVLGMLLIAATIPLENLIVFGGEVTATRVLGMGVFGLWLSRKLLRRESWQAVLASPLFIVTISLLGFAVASALWAEYPAEVFDGSLSLFRLFLWGVLVADLANSWDRIAWLVKGLVMFGLGAAILTIQQYLGGSDSLALRAGANIAGGINNTALVLVIIIPFAFYLIRAREGQPWRLFGMLYVTLATFAVTVTFSRMSLIMLALLLSAQFWETLRGPGGRGWLILLAGIILVAAVTMIPKSELGERLLTRVQTIEPYLSSSLAENDAGLLSSRGYHIRVGLAIFQDHPLVGAGYDNFGQLFLHDYQFRVDGAHKIWGSPRSPHGSYNGFLADLGLIGLALWLGVVAIALRNLAIARSIFASTKPSRRFLLVQAVTYGLLLQVAYGFFANVHGEKLVWLLLGLSVAVRYLAIQRVRLRVPVATSNVSVQA